MFSKRNRKHVLRVSIELQKHSWKFGRTRKSCKKTLVCGLCSHSISRPPKLPLVSHRDNQCLRILISSLSEKPIVWKLIKNLHSRKRLTSDRKAKIVLKKEIMVNSAILHAVPACHMFNSRVKYILLPGLRNKARHSRKLFFPKCSHVPFFLDDFGFFFSELWFYCVSKQAISVMTLTEGVLL